MRTALLIFLCLPLAAATVTITDTIYDPYGALWNGTVVLDCPSGTTAAGVAVARQVSTVTVTSGVFSKAIEVGDTGDPAGRSCTVRFTATNSRQRVTWSETWYVTAESTTIGDVRVTTTPTTTTTLNLSQLSLTGAAKGSIIAFGESWGVLTVGTNGYVLKADSTATRGIKWSASEASSGGAWGDILGTLSDQTDLQAALDAKVATTTQIIGGTGLTGGGDLSTNRTLAVEENSTNQKVIVSTSGTDVGTRKRVNFIAGDGISLTIGDNSAQDRVDVEIDSTGAAAGYGTIQEEGTPIPQRATLNAVGAAITASDDAGAGRTLFTLSQSPTASTSVVGTGRTLTATSPITGGGDLSADRAFACPTCTTAAAALTASRIIVGGGSQALAASSHVLPTGTVVGTTDTQTLTNKTLSVPSIADFSNATHDHSANNKGGNIPSTSVTGLGTAAVLDVGTTASKVVQLNASAQLPAVSAALLTNFPTGTEAGTLATGDHLHGGVYEPVDATIVRSSGDRTENAITIYDSDGNVIASDCSISGGVVSCGDGTEAALVALRELAANGESEFGIYGAESLAADACVVMPATQPSEGQILKASASTATPTGTALTCRVMEWATDTAPAMVGDSGSGGTAGLVPAPEAGDAAAGKYLKADGTWGVPPGGGGTGSIVLLAGYRQATTTRANWNISGASVETIGASEPYRQASISFRDANDDIASTWFVFPYDWDGETDPTITIHHTGSASQNAVVETSFSCPVADGATWSVAADPTFNTATSTTLTGPGSAARLIKQDTAAVDTTGCVPGSLAFIKVQRKGSDGSDGTGTWYLYAAEVVYAK